MNVKPTKRNILAIISSIYDPVGYLQPITVQLKILFQEICKVKVEWDDVVVKKVAPENWYYCQTDENPADAIARINNYTFIENTLFWEEPEYLKEKCFELHLTSNMEGVDNTSVRRSDRYETFCKE